MYEYTHSFAHDHSNEDDEEVAIFSNSKFIQLCDILVYRCKIKSFQ